MRRMVSASSMTMTQALVARRLDDLEDAVQVGQRVAAGDVALDAGAPSSTLAATFPLPESQDSSAAGLGDLALPA